MTATMTMERPVSGQLLREALSKLLTTADLQRLFRRSELTIAVWVRNEGLPIIRIPGQARDSVRYDRAEVLQWARDHGKRIFLEQEQDDED